MTAKIEKSTPRLKPKERLELSSTTKVFLLLLIFVFGVIGPLLLIYVIIPRYLKAQWAPFIPYLYISLSVSIIIIFLVILFYLTKGSSRLFPDEPDENTIEVRSETPGVGLEKVLKAEKRYKAFINSNNVQKSKKSEKSKRTKATKTAKNAPGKSDRLGSKPMEESIYEERVKLRSRSPKPIRARDQDKVTTFLCPDCGGRELYYEGGLITGYKYHCKDCDYIGTLVIEKDFKVDS